MNFSFKHMDRSESAEERAREGLKAMFDKFAQVPTSVNVIFSVNKRFQSAHLSCHLPSGAQIEIEENSENLYDAIDELCRKLQGRLVQVKEQYNADRKSTEKYDLAETVNRAEPDS